MHLNTRHRRALELDKILEKLAGHTGCEDSRQMALALEPCQSYEDAVLEMKRTASAHSLTNRFGTPSIRNLESPKGILRRAELGAALSMGELLQVAYILQLSRTLQSWQRQWSSEEEPLADLFFLLWSSKDLEDTILTSILSPDEMADTASPELGSIRRKIRQAEVRAKEQLDKLVRSSHYSKFLQEQLVTLRNGRFVVPVKAENRNEIKGLVHDTSSSGATLFVEPLAVVEANNAIRELENKEQHEIQRVLQELSGRVGEQAQSIGDSYRALVELDFQFAKSRLADEMRAVVPELAKDGNTKLLKARHPLIPTDKIVPIDVEIGGAFDTLVVTGPNTGGKTVALKTLGLLTLMAMCGLMVPAADASRISYFEKVLVDIGDEQSIEQSLSTFSGHMTNIIQILEQADNQSLVLIDELGAGTDPVEGAALAVSIISSLRQKGVRLAATTHYAEIKMYALQTAGVENASCEFDVATLRPTYRILIGVPGRSNAFAISRRLGLAEDIIEVAKNQVSTENTRFEDVVSSLEQTRIELEREREQAELFRQETSTVRQQAKKQKEELEKNKEQELERARAQARSLVEQVKLEAQELMDELESLKKQKDAESFSQEIAKAKGTFRGNLRKLEALADPVTRKTSAYKLPRALKRGDVVYIAELSTKGTVVGLPDSNGQVQVQAGIIKTKVPLSSLRLEENAQKVTLNRGAVNTRSAVAGAKEGARSELDLRGKMVDEALMELDRTLDTCILSNIKTLTIIHGKGTGALRTAVQQHLRRHRGIRTFRLGVYGEGDAGVTVAELK